MLNTNKRAVLKTVS